MPIRLSQRVRNLQPSATMAMAARAKELRDQGVDVIAFAAGEPDFDTPIHIKQAAIQALEAGQTKYASPASGLLPLREAVSRYFREFSGLDYPASTCTVNVGAKDSIYLALQAVIDDGDEVLVPAPYWVSYPEQVRLAGGRPVVLTPPDGSLKISGAQVRAALTDRTRLLILNSPSNPSGAVYTQRELADIADALAGTDVLVLSDEIYHRLVFIDEPYVSFAALPGMFERTLTVNGCSKTYAMTGWRVGFMAGPAGIIQAVNRLQGQATSGTVTFVQHAALAALTGDQECVERMRQTYVRRGRRMAEALNAMPGVSCPRPEGAFYCFPDVSGALERFGLADADGFAERVLSEAHVATVSGVAFGSPRNVRLSYATSDEAIDRGLERIARLLAG